MSDAKYEWFKRLYTKLTRFAFKVLNIFHLLSTSYNIKILSRHFMNSVWSSRMYILLVIWWWIFCTFENLCVGYVGHHLVDLDLAWLQTDFLVWFSMWVITRLRMILVWRASNWCMYYQQPCWNTWYWARDDFVNNGGISCVGCDVYDNQSISVSFITIH